MFTLSNFGGAIRPKLELIQNSGAHFFEFWGSEGLLLFKSEMFATASRARIAVKKFIASCKAGYHFEKCAHENGSHYFIVKSKEGELLGTSESYWSASSRDYALISVRRECVDAQITSSAGDRAGQLRM